MGVCASKTSLDIQTNIQKIGMTNVSLDKRSKGIYEMIKHIPVISALPEATQKLVSQRVVKETYEKGQVIVKQGDSGNKFYLITDGVCSVYQDGKMISSLRSGDYMGEQALIKTNLKRTATIKAAKPTTCFTMDNETFQSMTRSANFTFMDRSANRDAKNIYDDSEEIEDAELDLDEKMNYEKVRELCKSVKSNVLFQDMDKAARETILSKMKLKTFAKNTEIIKQGDKTRCNEFYIIESGSCDVLKNNAIVDTIHARAAFGELALVYNNPRNATVRTKTKADIWVLKRSQFKRDIRKLNQQLDQDKIQALRRVPLLATLLAADLAKFADTLTKQTFSRGYEFFKQGDVGDKFYLIMDGTVEGVETKPDGTQKMFELESGEFFGELALRTNNPRSATVVAASETICFVSDKAQFEALFGKFDNAMERQVEEYQKEVQSAKDYRSEFLMKRSLLDFESGPVVGRGKYGLVQFVRDPRSGTVYALKSVKKTWVNSRNIKQSKKRIDTLFNERNIMRMLNNSSFCIKLRGTFKDENSVYFLMEAARGGDVFNILKAKGYVDERTARFYVACLVEAIDYMHSNSIIHRDLKPENIVLSENGYGMLTDFGFAKKLGDNQKTYTMCGTPGYIAPEIILGQGYGKGSDWFAIGCVMFDMLTGAPPFPTRTDQFAMIQSMMNNSLQLPMYLSFWAKDLLRNLIQLKPMKRFGVVHGGTDKIRNHKWFEGFDWEQLRNGTMPAPIRPKLNSDFDVSGFDCDGLEQMSKELDAKHLTLQLSNELRNWDLDF